MVRILDQSWTTFEGYTSPLGIGWMCAGCGSYAGDDAPGSGFGCAPKTAGPGPGPGGSLCPFSRQCNYDCLQSTPDFPYFGHPGGLDDGHQSWHYFVDPVRDPARDPVRRGDTVMRLLLRPCRASCRASLPGGNCARGVVRSVPTTTRRT